MQTLFFFLGEEIRSDSVTLGFLSDDWLFKEDCVGAVTLIFKKGSLSKDQWQWSFRKLGSQSLS